MINEKKHREILTAVSRLIGRLMDELLLGLTVNKEFRVGLSPPISLGLLFAPLEYNFRFLNAFNLSCFFWISSICALEMKKRNNRWVVH